MENQRFIALDVETGGIGTDKSLLTLYAEVLDQNFQVLDSIDLKIKPDDEIYHCTADALRINKIDLVKHDTQAIAEKDAKRVLYNFLAVNSAQGGIKLIPLGQNVATDIRFLQAHIISQGTWEIFVSYRVRDTGTLGGSLLDAGLIPASVSGSLGSFCTHFGIDLNNAHNAKADTKATVAVYQAMLDLIRKKAV